MSNKTYDILKLIAQIILPALATFYITIAEIWKLPFEVEISGTIMAVDTFLGAILKYLSNKYAKKKKTKKEETC